ncbi:hypothetical protein BDP81DRAFT_407706 [Colletotrichum phormii]|uniref:Uncharacterized protein n=1 Tax=Colletotrichum phormii TaxID=359342 RepID=A0AAI9ZQT4_9PEZI|nr:uncharacterized protein BDP81DRAFT_407706 [Colletotrichum phormii]KAK1635313.1 hypothetical protein BDP81DRAFT_407706 [Colletotrichum phormii]
MGDEQGVLDREVEEILRQAPDVLGASARLTENVGHTSGSMLEFGNKVNEWAKSFPNNCIVHVYVCLENQKSSGELAAAAERRQATERRAAAIIKETKANRARMLSTNDGSRAHQTIAPPRPSEYNPSEVGVASRLITAREAPSGTSKERLPNTASATTGSSDPSIKVEGHRDMKQALPGTVKGGLLKTVPLDSGFNRKRTASEPPVVWACPRMAQEAPLNKERKAEFETRGMEVFDYEMRFKKTAVCGSCGHKHHFLPDCPRPDATTDWLAVCPLCNNKNHNWDDCERARRLPWKQQYELMFLRRINMPPILSRKPWILWEKERIDRGIKQRQLDGMYPYTLGYVAELKTKATPHWVTYQPTQLKTQRMDIFPRDSATFRYRPEQLVNYAPLLEEDYTPTDNTSQAAAALPLPQGGPVTLPQGGPVPLNTADASMEVDSVGPVSNPAAPPLVQSENTSTVSHGEAMEGVDNTGVAPPVAATAPPPEVSDDAFAASYQAVEDLQASQASEKAFNLEALAKEIPAKPVAPTKPPIDGDGDLINYSDEEVVYDPKPLAKSPKKKAAAKAAQETPVEEEL